MLVAIGSAGHSNETASDKLEEGGDDVKSSWPLCPGLHTCDNGTDSGMQSRKAEPIHKPCPSTDRGLQFARVKMELLVNAGQTYCVEYVPGDCTHRPSHHPSRVHQKSVSLTQEETAEGVLGKEGEVVTRQVYENVRLDHLLSKELMALRGYP